eukprot:m.8064 g.8064  ORF g.8064 m.8064 type:complete len:450 (+) comp3833_c0_seq1:78-1427(+)
MAGSKTLKEVDEEVFNLVEEEKQRQKSCIELIASENFTSRAVMDCLGSALTNKYAEGTVGQRYYGGTEVVDKVESLCQSRALKAFHLDASKWAVNVQPYSGSPANFAVYTALLRPHDRVMGLDLPSGGHLTHGYYSYTPSTGEKKAISATSHYFESLPYKVNSEGFIDLDDLEKMANVFKPNMIICGGSAYPREWPYKRFREIADSCGAFLLCDMAHISGLVATQEADSPFEYCDVVTTTTHKTLRGPRSGMIFSRIDERGFPEKINFSVFPMLQGGPHEHQIAALATQLKEVMSPEFKTYIQQVKANSQALGDYLVSKGYKLATGGTENHLLLWDLRPVGITGSKMEKTCDACSITLNKNCVAGDRSALTPGGVRIGAPAMTTRGLKEEEFKKIGEFLHRAVEIAVGIQEKVGKKLKDFVVALEGNEDVAKLKADVNAYSSTFYMPGH